MVLEVFECNWLARSAPRLLQCGILSLITGFQQSRVKVSLTWRVQLSEKQSE